MTPSSHPRSSHSACRSSPTPSPATRPPSKLPPPPHPPAPRPRYPLRHQPRRRRSCPGYTSGRRPCTSGSTPGHEAAEVGDALEPCEGTLWGHHDDLPVATFPTQRQRKVDVALSRYCKGEVHRHLV